jgi:hypothetical protein
MIDFIAIFNLMKQAPEFSMMVSAFFIYLFYYWLKNQGEKKILDMLQPVKQDISEIKQDLVKIKQNNCVK